MESGPATEPRWNAAKKFSFLFFASFFIIFFFPAPLWYLPGTGAIWRFTHQCWTACIGWTGAHFFGLAQVSASYTGSGDTSYHWLALLICAASALVLAVLGLALDRKRPNYQKALACLYIYLRYVLASLMLSYGFSKIYPLQFGIAGDLRLQTRLGDLSPMGLLWSFMGYSRPYTVFAGLGELTGGALLFFRRTTTLGALILAGVLANVAMLNFSYDVPVKIESTLYLVIALFLLAPDAGRLLDLLLLNRPIAARPLAAPFSSRRVIWGGYLLKTVYIIFIVHLHFTSNRDYALGRKTAQKAPFNDSWWVAKVLRNGFVLQPFTGSTLDWAYIYIPAPGDTDAGATLVEAFDRPLTGQLDLTHDQKIGTLILLRAATGESKLTAIPMQATHPDLEHTVLEGTLDGVSLRVELEKEPASSSKLLGRGFHWINEYPYNR